MLYFKPTEDRKFFDDVNPHQLSKELGVGYSYVYRASKGQTALTYDQYLKFKRAKKAILKRRKKK